MGFYRFLFFYTYVLNQISNRSSVIVKKINIYSILVARVFELDFLRALNIFYLTNINIQLGKLLKYLT